MGLAGTLGEQSFKNFSELQWSMHKNMAFSSQIIKVIFKKCKMFFSDNYI